MPDLDAFKTQLSEAPAPLYAVLDGAQFDDLPGLLFDHDFKHKPLYMDMGSEDREIARTAPQFVRFDTWDYWENGLTPQQRAESLIDILELPASAVFWSYAGENPKLLFRHLRTINYILIPRDADTPPMPDPLDPEGQTHGNTKTHQRVLFRHADANVIAQVVPELGQHRLPRFFGPAQSVIAAPDAEWSMGEDIMVFDNPGGEYNTKKMMALSKRTMKRIDKRRDMGFRVKIANYVRGEEPTATQSMSDADLLKEVILAEKVGDKIGFEDQDSYREWSLMAVKTGRGILSDDRLISALQEFTRPDDNIETLLEAVNAGQEPITGVIQL